MRKYRLLIEKNLQNPDNITYWSRREKDRLLHFFKFQGQVEVNGQPSGFVNIEAIFMGTPERIALDKNNCVSIEVGGIDKLTWHETFSRQKEKNLATAISNSAWEKMNKTLFKNYFYLKLQSLKQVTV